MIRLLLPALCLPSCISTGLPEEAPPLRDMEEPLVWQSEPEDEAQRLQLPLGSFSGLALKSAWFEEPDEPGQQPDALEVTRIVENSPAAAAELREGDLLLTVQIGTGEPEQLGWPGQWSKIEAASEPDTVLELTYDRAGAERRTELVLVPRIQPAERSVAERFREEQRTGIVVRTATEVEARSAGLGAGAGAVLIGMSSDSPWRRAGLLFGDLIVAVEGQPIHHPQALLGAIRTAPADSLLAVEYRRPSRDTRSIKIPLTSREQNLYSLSVPPLFSYSSRRGTSETSVLYGLFWYESTAAAWEVGFLWFFSLSGGDSDVLEEVRR